MTILDLILQTAKKEIGIKEDPITHHNPRIIYFDSFTSLKATSDKIPWCAAFVCYVLETCGIESTKSASARSYLDWGEPVKDPIPGAIAVFSRGLDVKLGHVGIIDQCHGSMVDIIGGNQHNSVSVSTFVTSHILSIRVPTNYKAMELSL